MPNGIGPQQIGGVGITQAQLLSQIQQSIGANLALAPPGTFFPRPINLRPLIPQRPRPTPQPFLALGPAPILGDGQVSNIPPGGVGNGRVSCCRELECKSVIRQSIATVSFDGRQVLGANARRLAVVFVGLSPLLYLISANPIVGSAFDAMFVFTGPNEREVLAKDYGSAVGGLWYCATEAPGSFRLTMNEVIAIN